MQSSPGLLLFDLDGTLVDTRLDIANAVNAMREQFGLEPLTLQAVCDSVGKGIHYLIEHVLPGLTQDQVEQGLLIYQAHYTEHLLDNSVIYPGVVELLEHFKDVPKAVVTNKPGVYSQIILEKLDLQPHFFDLIAGDSEYPKKPDPTGVHAMRQACGVPVERTVFVGDSSVDIQTGQQAGVETWVVAQGFEPEERLRASQPEFLFKDVEALMTTLRSL